MRRKFLFDVHVPKAVVEQLRLRGYEAVAAQELELDRVEDEELLRYATRFGFTLVTHDTDFLRLSAEFGSRSEPFSCIAFSRQARISVGELVSDLALIAEASEPVENEVVFLPLSRPY